jgi:Tfp pilus assembly protein FimT
MLIGIAIIGMIASVTFPAMLNLQRRAAAHNATAEIRAIFFSARMRAIARSRNCGLKFTKASDGWHYAVYDDGDGDGVRSDDITSGVDKLVQSSRRVLAAEEQRATIGLLPMKMVDPDGDPLLPTKSPVNFNNSTICSFTPVGESTPGTIYITDSLTQLYAIRVRADSARIRVLRWNNGKQKWEQQ